MSILKNIRLGLLHVGVAMTFVLINGVLNRVMIDNLGILASVMAVFVVLPYVLSPLQVWIGQYSDTHPFFGYRRTPYIALGIVLCTIGLVLTPHAAFLIASDGIGGAPLAIVAFGLWGFGYNLAVVTYLSLASDLSTEQNRSRTIAVMWFMMISGIIATSIIVGIALENYSNAQLINVFNVTALIILGLAILGLVGVEPRYQDRPAQSRESQRAAIRAVVTNPQARLFFTYLILLLATIQGQDVLLEPFGGQVFGMDEQETTFLTAIWGSATLIALLFYGFLLSRWLDKKRGAMLGGAIAIVGLILIVISGVFTNPFLFIPGISALGFGTGIATSTNLGLMLDMTTPEQAGLFIGAWGLADALARGTGTLLGGVMRDVVTYLTNSVNTGYVSVFFVQALMLVVSLIMLRYINVTAFRDNQPSLTDLVALQGDA
ncbi:MAG: BCD family MFS transporter [Chloroflexota bacterium]